MGLNVGFDALHTMDSIYKHILKHNDLGSSRGTFSTSPSVFLYGISVFSKSYTGLLPTG